MTADIFVWLVVHVRVCVFIMSVYCVCVICPYTPSHSVLSLLFFFFLVQETDVHPDNLY